jgi:hypothetical protein
MMAAAVSQASRPRVQPQEGEIDMGFLIYGIFRLFFLAIGLAIWLMLAMVVGFVALIALATGNHHAARKMGRSLGSARLR